MKKLFLILTLLVAGASIKAQELYVSTEPASNMPKDAIGLRLTQEGSLDNHYRGRWIPEVMVGLNKNLMVHGAYYLSNFFQSQYQPEAWSLYGKYRFLSLDSTNRHFRGAFFAKYAQSKNPVLFEELNLDGDNTGWQAGVVFTQLLHKLALSGSLSYTRALDNSKGNILPSEMSKECLNYTFSSGLLVYPKSYRDYKQTNVNLYVEFLGKSNLGSKANLMEVAPAVQLILNSNCRIDISQRFQLWGNMSRSGKNMYLLRMEYNLFNVL